MRRSRGAAQTRDLALHRGGRSLRFVRAVAPIFVAVTLAVLTFVLGATWQLGWLSDGEGDSRVIPIRRIPEEALPLGYRAGMMNAWIHNIRVGQVVGFHEHPTRAEMVVILRGRARVRGLRMAPDGGEPLIREEILGPGHIVFSPATSLHEYTNVGNEPLWCLVFMSPPVKGNVYLEGAAPKSALDFLAFKGHARTILLDHFNREFFHPLVRREPSMAEKTLAAAADDVAVVTGSRINHAVVVGAAKWTFHKAGEIYRVISTGRHA